MDAIKDSIEFFLYELPHNDLHHTLSVRRFQYLDAHKSRPFGKAYVEFKPDDVDRNYVVRMKTVFQEGFNCLEKYISNEMEQLSKSQKESLQCLLQFLQKKDDHLQCLARFMSNEAVQENENDEIASKEVLYTVLLAEHLFAPLTPSNCYLLDRICFPEKPVECPGGCHVRRPDTTKKLKLTHTGIGHPDVWHGYQDIFLATGVSVTFTENVDSEYETWANEYGEEQLSEVPQRKQRNYTPVTEIKQENENFGIDETVTQAVSQTIVNAFMQKNKHLLIPTICTSYGSIKVYMYEPENDIFLTTPEKCTLEMFNFQSKTFLSDINIIYLWMILNFDVFSKLPEKIIDKVEEKGLHSGFPRFAGDKISVYRDKLRYGLEHFNSNLGPHPSPVAHIFLDD